MQRTTRADYGVIEQTLGHESITSRRESREYTPTSRWFLGTPPSDQFSCMQSRSIRLRMSCAV